MQPVPCDHRSGGTGLRGLPTPMGRLGCRGPGQLPTRRCHRYLHRYLLLPLKLSGGRSYAGGIDQTPLGHLEQPALGAGLCLRRRPQPGEDRTCRPDPGGEQALGTEPEPVGRQSKSRHQYQTQTSRMGLRLPAQSPVAMKCGSPVGATGQVDLVPGLEYDWACESLRRGSGKWRSRGNGGEGHSRRG